MSSDNQLQHAVLAELSWDPSINAAHIGVTASDGIVTLTGHVGTFAQKHAAEDAVRRVKGVKAVAEEIKVRLAFEAERSDDDIAAAAVGRLGGNVALPRDAVTLTVEKGWITLVGQVEWHYQKDAAEQDVRHLSGVVGVSNRIAIKPRIDVTNIGDEIMHALHRSWFFDPKTITVTGDGGKVRLTGTVHTPNERQVAAATAWAAPGVADVTNEIRII
ncbi:MAG: ornithine aminotransferase [Rhodospirillales bacterium]|nr:ornithine aminotransferase [Rhodospirillales bacterium]